MAKKSCLLVFLMLFCTLAVQSNPVEVARARKVAMNHLRTNHLCDKTKAAPVLTDVTSMTPFTEFYVFAVDANKGFVLVSADDCARPILGYSVNSEFRTENIPAHVLAWLQGYEREIRAAREQGIVATDRIAAEWHRLDAGERPQRDIVPIVDGLTTTIWNQSPYYNDLCPYDSQADEKSVTGCVATAMGQLMKYWNHPTHGTGSHSYSSDYGTLSANFAATTYDWGNMPDYLTSYSSAAELNAVATLLYHCGVAVEMEYSPSGSGASTIGEGITCETALKNYFKYSSSLYGDYKYSYSDAVWKQMVMAELDAARPLIYRGQGESGGHCFICDGYDSDTNFRFNWGWSGYYNAFYPLSALDPTTSMSFTDYQGAIFGIVPNGVGLAPLNISITNTLPTSVTVIWSDPNATAADNFIVAYGSAATFDTANSATYTTVNTTNLQYVIQGLTAYTQYKVAIRSNCGGTLSPWTAPVSFTTAAPAQPLPITANFEGTMPTYWLQEYVGGNTDWNFTAQGGYLNNPNGALSGSYNARFFQDGYGSITRLITPILNMVGDAQMEYSGNTIGKLTFGHAQIPWQGDQDELRIYYRSTPTDSWTLLASYTTEIDWRRDTLLLPNISGNYQVAFEATANYGYGVCLDDVRIFTEAITGNYATAPYTCDFSDTAENNAWVTVNGTETNKWYIGMGTAAGFDNPYSLYVSSDNGMSNYYNVNNTSTVFAYRDITLNAGQYAYSYNWVANGESGRDYLRFALVPESVALTAGSIAGWSENTLPSGAIALDGGSRLNDQYEWQSENDVVDVPTTGNYRLVALWHNDDQYGYQPPAALDNIRMLTNSCTLPTNLMAGNITDNSATLTWTPGGSEGRWSIKINGITHYSNTASYQVTGLLPNTEYTVELRAICGNDTSLAPRRLTFRTECGPAVLPFSYGFEDAPVGAGSAMPDCWHRISSNNYPYVVTSNAHNGSRSLYFHSSFTQYAVLPSVSAPIHTLQMSLWARTAAANSTALIVGIMSDPNDANTFVPVETLSNLSTTYTEYNVSFEDYSGTGIFPAIKVAAGNMNYIYVDDISLSACTYIVTPSVSFTETFENNSNTRECWTQEHIVGTIDWSYATGGHSSYPSNAHGGSLNALFYHSSHGNTTRLISPTFVTSSLPAIKVSFWHAQRVWSYDQDGLAVYYRTSLASPWTRLDTFTTNIAAWTLNEYYLPASDSLQISFVGDAEYGYGVVLDDISIEEAPYCGEVTNLTASISDTAAATVHLSWNGSLSSGGYFRIQYGEHGFDPSNGEGITINNVTSTNYSIPYLHLNTTYDFYVTTFCNSQQQSNDVMVSQYIPSLPVRTFPYICSFDNPADSNQWIFVNGDQTNKWVIGTAAGNDASNPHALYISNDGGVSNYYTGYTSYVYAYRDMVLTPGLYDYSYEWRCNGESTYDYLRVALLPQNIVITAGSYTGWSTTAVPTGAIALDGGTRLNEQTTWQTGTQGDFTIAQAGTYRLVFFWRNDGSVNNQPPAAIDNIVIQKNECGYLSDPVAVAIDTSTIQLSWTGALTGSAHYSVEFGPAGFTRGTGAVLDNIISPQITINSLSTNTIYDFYVTLVCPVQLLAPTVMATGRTMSIPITLPYQTSFDNQQDNNLWVMLNEGQTNQWAIGGATGDGDYHALYISNDGGVSYNYNTSYTSTVFAYRTVDLTADSFSYSYSWKNYGESAYDYLRVALVPASIALTSGSNTGWTTTTLPAGSIALDGGSQLMSQSNWQQRSGNINVTQAGTYNLVFYWRNDGSYGSQPPAAIDNLVLARNNCNMPSNVVATRVDSNSITLTWDNVANTSWRVGYGDIYDTVQVNSATITGLTPGTEYNLNVMTLCEIGFSVPAILSVKTLCSPMSLPYSYGFEDATGSGASHTINACWRWGNDHPNATSTAYPYSTSHAGWYAWFTNTTSATGTYLVVPAVAHPMNQLELSFWARRTSTGSSYYGDLEIGVVDNPYNFASFHKIADIEVENTSWHQYFVYTDNYQGSNGFLCIRAPYRTSGYNDIYIDDIIVDTLPDCSEPVNIATSVMANGATLTWHGIGHNVRWGVEYGQQGFILGSGTFAYTDDTTFTIMGLQPATTYDVYIYTDCHHATSEAAMVTFTTSCGTVSVPYVENFDSYETGQTASIDPCWYKMYSYNNNTTSYPYPSTSQSQYTGSKALYFSSGSNYYCYAALPEFDQPINTLQMTLKVNKYMGYNVQVGYMTDPTNFSTFHSVSTISPTQNYSWESFTVPFNTVSSTVSHPHMVIVAPSGNSGNIVLVDDVEVDVIPPCNAPTNLTVSNITASSATLNWTASTGVTHYRIEIGVDGFSEGSGSIIDSISGTSYTLTGLQPGYTYNVYVSSICQNGLGYSASINTTFTTICGLTQVPYTENFDTYQTMPSAQISPCWHKGYGTSDSQYSYPYPNAANAQYPGSISLYFYGYNTSYSYAALPLFADSIQNLQLTFKAYGDGNAVVSVGYLTSQDNYNSFQQVASITPANGSWTTHTVQFNDVTGTNRYMCIAARGNTTNNRFYIDDVTVERIPNCPSVASVSIDSITDTRVVISWPAVLGVTQYQVEYGLVGYPAGFGTVIDNISSTSVALSNLTPSTNYSVSVRAKCSENNLGAATSIIFTTPCVLETVPYSYGFEYWSSTGGNQPIHPCWTQLTNSTSTIYPTVTTAASYQGSASIMFMSNNTTYSCAVLPMFADSVQDLQLSFYARRQNSNGGNVLVGVISDLNNYSSFRPVQSFQAPQGQNWEQFTATFDTVTGQQLWMAIATPISTTGGTSYVYVDNIEVNYHQPYCLHLTIADSTRGSVQVSGNATADGRFWPGTSVTLTAMPNPGYDFGHWAVGNSVNPYTFTMPSYDVYYNNIVFNKIQYSIAATSSDVAGGYVTGSGFYNYLDTALLTAHSNPGYFFSGWNDGNTDNPRNVVVTSDSSFTATFLWGCPDAFQSDIIEACDQYTWDATGNTYTMSGMYLHSYTDQNLCDIVDTLYLTINHSQTGNDVYAGCDQYSWHGQTYTASGTYVDTLMSTHNCDSVVSLTLTLGHSNSYTDVQAACDSLVWHGNTYLASTNTPTFTATNASGCDSVVALNLTLGHSSSMTYTHSACNGYAWQGQYYLVSGTYYHHLTNASNCDSTEILQLTINHDVSTTFGDTACDSYTWMGQTYAQSGSYTNHLQSVVGCDSSVTLHLTINYSTQYTDIQSACDSFAWHGNTYTASTTAATFTTANAVGCDSVVTLNLTLGHSNSYTDVQSACDSYTWHDSTYTASTSAPTYTATNASGCDSVVTLNLTLGYSNSSLEPHAACDSYAWHGQTYTQSGSYADTLTNAAGCDSVVTLLLTINNSVTTNIADTACDSYAWYGANYTQTGTYSFRVSTAAGCDSNLILHLVINRSAASTDTRFACDSLTWIDGLTYTAGTSVPAVTMSTVQGCDSVVTLNLTLGHSSSYTDVQSACDSYTWHDSTYTASTSTPTYTTTNASGCDSVTTLQLTINNSAYAELSHSTCDGYYWHGRSLSATGDYIDSSLTAAGCDNITLLHLTVNHSTYAYMADTACDSYTWPVSGETYTETNIYFDTLQTIAGCDSLLALGLVINHSYQASLSDTACDSYSWHGAVYQHSGSYTFDSVTAEGCAYHESLSLVVNQGTYTAYHQQYCDDFFWNGQSYGESGIYTYDYVNAVGCPSTDTLHLTIDHHSDTAYYATACDSYTWNGTTYTESGVYTYDYSQFIGTCINVDTLYLTIHNSALYLESLVPCDSLFWNGNLYTVDGTYFLDTVTSFGCDSTVQLNLTFRHATFHIDTVEVCDGYTWDADSNYYYRSGTYTYQTTNAEGCDSNMTLLLTVHPSYDTWGMSPQVMEACDSYEWNGRIYTESGYYIDTLQTIFGCDSITELYLRVNHGYYRTDTITECNSYTWLDGITYTGTPAAMPVIADTTAGGCDSILTLDLTINYSTYGVLYQNYCDTFTWHGQTYSESGVYPYDFVNDAGCASTDTLYLTITTGVDTAYYVTTCDSYNWNDSLYTQSGVYLYDYSIIGSSCTNVDTLYLTVNYSTSSTDSIVACDSYTWIDGIVYSQSISGPQFTAVTNHGCDSVVTLVLTVNYNTSTAYYDTILEGETYHWDRDGSDYTTQGVYTYDYTTDAGCASTDTLYLTVNPLHDTVFYTVRGLVNDTAMGYVVIYPDTVIAEYQAAYVVAVPHEGYRFQQWQDGDTHQLRIVWVESDTTLTAAFEATVGIASVETAAFAIWTDRSAIHIQGAGLIGHQVSVYDAAGRRFAMVTATDEHLLVQHGQWPTGVYFVKVDNAPAQRVVLQR